MEKFFVTLKAFGRLGDDGKPLIEMSTITKRIPAKADQPLALIRQLIELFSPSMTYSTDDAATADLEQFKAYVACLRLSSRAPVVCDSCGKSEVGLQVDEVGFCNYCAINADH